MISSDKIRFDLVSSASETQNKKVLSQPDCLRYRTWLGSNFVKKLFLSLNDVQPLQDTRTTRAKGLRNKSHSLWGYVENITVNPKLTG